VAWRYRRLGCAIWGITAEIEMSRLSGSWRGAAGLATVVTAAACFKAQGRWIGLLSQIYIRGPELYQGHTPPIGPAATAYPGCLPDIDAQTIPGSIVLDVPVGIVQLCIVHPRRRFAFAPYPYLKA
jgi:hypothetical protein